MSSGGGGGGGTPANTTNVQTIREAPEIEARRLGLMDQAAKLAGTQLGLPAFQVAGLTAEEQAGITQATTGVGAGLPSIQAAEQAATGAGTRAGQFATGAVGAAALDPSSQQFQQYLNPYQSYIVDEINRQAQQGQQRVAQQAISAGAFGGGREGIQRAEAERARLSEIGLAQGRAFQGALGAFQQGQQLQAQTGLAAGQQALAAGQLGAQTGLSAGQMRMAQQAQDVQGLLQAGGLERGVEQAKLEAARQTKVQDITDPYQRLSFVSDIQRGAPSTQTTVAQGFAPTASPFAQAVGTGIGAYAALAPK